MHINSDLTKPAAVDSGSLPWVPSPLPGVHRRMLERDGEEVARATSIVRYAPDSSFSPHTHAKGEEFLVLSGVFSDETGDFPCGMYVRNPPGSSHTPSSRPGCEILVKLRQMHPEDDHYVRVDSRDESLWRKVGTGQAHLALFEGFGEQVALIRVATGVSLGETFPAGAEFFVIDGAFEDEQGLHGKGCWLRLPADSRHVLRALEPTVFYRKTGHLSGPEPHQ